MPRKKEVKPEVVTDQNMMLTNDKIFEDVNVNDKILNYFNILKTKVQNANIDNLKQVYENCLILMDKYNRTNQIDAIKKLFDYIDMLEKEIKSVNFGVNRFVYRDDIEKIKKELEEVGKYIKFIELSRYEREIPDDIVKRYELVKDLFDEFIVVFTDYTKEQDHEIKTNKERDPILFGVFTDGVDKTIKGQRLYFIGDWIDDYCDLTLDKLVEHYSDHNKNDPDKQLVYTIRTPKDLEQLRRKITFLDKESKNGKGIGDIYKTNKEFNLIKKIINIFKRK